MRSSGEPRPTLMRLPSNEAGSTQAGRRLVEHLRKAGVDVDTATRIRLAMHEAIVNAAEHGNHWDANLGIQVEWSITDDRVVISVQDEGDGFRLEDIPDPTSDENIRKPTGRGLLLIRTLMDDIQLPPPGNRLTMVKRIEHGG